MFATIWLGIHRTLTDLYGVLKTQVKLHILNNKDTFDRTKSWKSLDHAKIKSQIGSLEKELEIDTKLVEWLLYNRHKANRKISPAEGTEASFPWLMKYDANGWLSLFQLQSPPRALASHSSLSRLILSRRQPNLCRQCGPGTRWCVKSCGLGLNTCSTLYVAYLTSESTSLKRQGPVMQTFCGEELTTQRDKLISTPEHSVSKYLSNLLLSPGSEEEEG